MNKSLRVTVWNEYRHEKKNEKVRSIYPDGMHTVIAEFLNKQEGIEAITATLDEAEHGLTDEVLNNTDVLTWWGHTAHGEVSDEVVEKVHKRVLEGMGLIVLHSGHFSKIFRKLMGTTCDLKWREIGENERLWVIEPGHPIVDGIGECIEIPHEEMYGEHFDIPAPDTLVFVSWFGGGEVFRSGCCYQRGNGKIFYFRPGHETFPIYHQADIQKVITNAVKWAAPVNGPQYKRGHVPEPLEKVN
ncbi:MAG: trehalose utilization protein ThuA [Clostridiales bacterium]|nr:trehalose utilization protein ThuA [Clostridiales bacterium]